MKSIRKRNPLMFDLALFLAFSIVSLCAYLITNEVGIAGALFSIAMLSLISLALIFSR
jgi:hypothetical protein